MHIRWSILTILTLSAFCYFAKAQSPAIPTSQIKQSNYIIKRLAVGKDAPSANFLSINIADSITQNTLPFATISICKKSSITRSAGNLTINNIIPYKDSIQIQASQIGYKSASVTIKNIPFPCAITILLSQEAQFVQEIVIRPNNKAAYIFNGDTLEFNVKRFKTIKGASLSDLLSKFPGVEIMGGGLYFNGAKIEKITINKNPLLSNNLKAILKSLNPEDITGFKVFKEISEWDIINGTKYPQKHLVADISTKEALPNISIKKIKASKAIYGNHSQKPLNGVMSFSTTNADSLHTFDTSPYYENSVTDSIGSALLRIPVSYSKNKNRKGLSFNTENLLSYNENKSINHFVGIIQTDLDTSTIQGKINSQESHFNKNRQPSFSTINNIEYDRGVKGILNASVSFNYLSTNNNNSHYTTKSTDGLLASNSTLSNESKDDANGKIFLKYKKNFTKTKILLTSHTNIITTINNGRTIMHKDLNNLMYDNNIKLKHFDNKAYETITLSKVVGKYTFSLDGHIGYSQKNSKRFSKDIERMTIDTLGSFNTITKEFEYANGFNITRHFGEAYILTGYTHSEDYVSLFERFPMSETNKNHYYYNNINANIYIPLGTLSLLNIKADRSNQLLSSFETESIDFSKFRGKIDDSNSLEIKAFDKNIKIPTITDIFATAEIATLNLGLLYLQVNLNFVENNISQNVTIFKEKTYLEKYNYTITPGIILKEYSNMGNSSNIDLTFRYDKYIPFIGNTLRVKYSHKIQNNPISINGINQKERSLSNNYYISLQSSFSKYFEYNLHYSATFINTQLSSSTHNSKFFTYGCIINTIPFEPLNIVANFHEEVAHTSIDGKTRQTPIFSLMLSYTCKLRNNHSLQFYILGDKLFTKRYIDRTTLTGYLYNRIYTAQQGNLISFGIAIK